MSFANGAFVLISTIENGRKETEDVTQSDEDGARNGTEEEVKQAVRFELSALSCKLIKGLSVFERIFDSQSFINVLECG